MKNFEFLFAAYMIIFALIGFYVFNISSRLKKLEKREKED
ncbi:MAG: CcmD family protein [Deferribacteraceae bacterium]|jgi:CcmD family protein|nr:CcmD family protein [Deferribacteraceae bacterium]